MLSTIRIDRVAAFTLKLTVLPPHPAYFAVTVDVSVLIGECETGKGTAARGQIFHLPALVCVQIDPFDPVSRFHRMEGVCHRHSEGVFFETAEYGVIDAMLRAQILHDLKGDKLMPATQNLRTLRHAPGRPVYDEYTATVRAREK
jgi:hypothetical protein